MSTRVPGPLNYSGAAMGVADLNGDGLDDVVRLEDLSDPDILLQDVNGNFVRYDLTGIFNADGFWGLCIGDVDNNGANDIAFGGINGTSLLRGGTVNGQFTWFSSDMPSTQFQQGANFADIDNDGWVDHFACDDVALSVPSRNTGDGTGSFFEDYTLINPVSTVPSDNSGNYASIWTDFDDDGDLDLYLSKCRQGVTNRDDGRRLNQLFRNDGAAGFTDVAGAAGLLPRAQTWSADFADVDNDGDLDAFLLNHDFLSELLINDGNNVFTNESSARGVNEPVAGPLGIQCNFEDFDNDGWVDLLLTYSGGLAKIYLNDGTGNFSTLTGSAIVGTTSDQTFQSVATGDLNNDGYVDLYTGNASGFNNPSGTPDGLLINNGGSNNFLTVRLQGSGSNLSGIGAKIKIYGSWGVQTREIRSGEGYGVSNSLTAHFGVGTDTEITRLVIQWPSGLIEETLNVATNERLVIPEGSLTATLPLSWSSCTATAVDNKYVRLDWETTREVATSHFIAERRDGRNWSFVGRVPAQNTAGQHAYQLTDNRAQTGENVYRIRQVDLTGAETVSPLVVAVLADSETFDLYPNPANDRVALRHDLGDNAVFTLEDLTGRIMLSFGGNELDLATVPAGVYLVRGGRQVKKLVVR